MIPMPFRVLSIAVLGLVLLVSASADDGAQAWQRRLEAIGRMADDAKALEAIEAIERELGDQTSPSSRFRLGELFVRAKLPRLDRMAQGALALRAIALFEGVIADDPEHLAALYYHARTCLALPALFGKREAGVASLAALVSHAETHPGSVPHPEVFLLLARLAPDGARRTLDIGLRSFPEDARLIAARAALEEAEPQEPEVPAEEAARTAKARFRAALRKGTLEYGVLDRALAAGQQRHPQDHEFPLFRALLRLWRTEIATDAQAVSEAIELLRAAQRLGPGDTRIAGWLGPVLYTVGHRVGKAEMVEEGQALMDQGALVNPEQNLFGRAFAYRVTRTHPERVEQDLYAMFEACTGQRMDRARFLVGGAASAHRSCGDPASAPHNVSGTLFWAGEYFRDRRDPKRARDAYRGALEADEAGTWPYRRLAEQRLSHLAGETGQALAPAPVSCLLCHQHE